MTVRDLNRKPQPPAGPPAAETKVIVVHVGPPDALKLVMTQAGAKEMHRALGEVLMDVASAKNFQRKGRFVVFNEVHSANGFGTITGQPSSADLKEFMNACGEA